MSDLENTLTERGNRYGDFSDHAAIAQALQRVMQKAERASPVVNQTARPLVWECLSDVQRQALTVIADKIARILSGDPNYADNWHDIQGYARLVEQRLPGMVEVRNGAPEFEADPLGFRKWCERDGCLVSFHGDAAFCEQHTPKTVEPAPVGPTIAEQVESGDLPPAHPTWPSNKTYRWMAQTCTGSWYAYERQPYLSAFNEAWVVSGELVKLCDTPQNPNWRDTLIERGADE